MNGYHVVFLTQNVMIAMGLLSMPFQLSPVGYSQWWFPVMFGVVANLTLIPMILICSKFPEDDLFTIHEKLLGKKAGKALNVTLIIMFSLLMASTVERYLEMIQVVVLPYRTILGPMLLLLAMAVLIAKRGIKSVARFCMISFFITAPMVYLLRWSLAEGDFTHLFPLFNFTAKEFLQASSSGYTSIVGYEMILFYYPYIVRPKKAFKQATIGIWITIFFYTAVCAASVIHFSEWQMENLLYPVLNLFKYVELSFIEKIDTVGITLWVFLILSTIAAFLWLMKEGIDSVRSKTHPSHIYIVVALIAVIVYVPLSQALEEKVYGKIFYASYFLILWPNVLLVIQYVKSKAKKKEGYQ